MIRAVGKAGMLPELSELSTPQLWNLAKVKYGSTVINRTAAIAGLYLVDKHGAGSIIAWCKAVKETGDAELAFQKVFGVTTTQFSSEFANYLRNKVKKAS